MKKTLGIIFGSVIAAVICFTILNEVKTQPVLGSVIQGSEYHSTSTPNGTGSLMTIATGTPGTFGSVIITGTSTGAFTVFDATTTDITLRTGGKATSSITIASFPAGEIPGTYTFDTQYSNGLIVQFSGTIGSTTITYR